MIKPKQVFAKRKFLCPVTEEVDSWIKGLITETLDDNYVNLNAELAIADCNRTVNLYFSVYHGCSGDGVKEAKKDLRRARKKLDKLQDFITEFCEAAHASLDNLEDVL